MPPDSVNAFVVFRWLQVTFLCTAVTLTVSLYNLMSQQLLDGLPENISWNKITWCHPDWCNQHDCAICCFQINCLKTNTSSNWLFNWSKFNHSVHSNNVRWFKFICFWIQRNQVAFWRNCNVNCLCCQSSIPCTDTPPEGVCVGVSPSLFMSTILSLCGSTERISLQLTFSQCPLPKAQTVKISLTVNAVFQGRFSLKSCTLHPTIYQPQNRCMSLWAIDSSKWLQTGELVK